MRPTNTVNNEQQADRGISVIAPLRAWWASGLCGGVDGWRGGAQSVWLWLVHSFGCGWSTRV